MSISRGNIVRLMTVFVMTALLVACLAACSNDGGGSAADSGGGIVGTGKQVVVRGEVTGFGSGVIVNGIEFARSSDPGVSETPIELAFENVSTGREDALRTGMVVAVSGSYDSASGKGSYTRIVFSPELRGPLDNVPVDAAAGTFKVLGRTIQAGVSTIFDGIADLNELAGRQNQNLELEVSGYLDAQGRIQASRIALKSDGFTSGRIQLKGVITDLGGGSFSIGGVSVTTGGADFVNMSAADLGLGLMVEVRGTLSGNVIGSARIERKSSTSGVPAGETMRIKGVTAGSLSGNSFVMAGPDGTLTVTTSGAVFLQGKSLADASIVVAGARLEVEGKVLADGSLAARQVEAETGRTVRLAGDLTAVVDVSSGTLVLNNVTVRTDKGASFRDNRKTPSPVANLTLSELAPGDHLRVDGFVDGNGEVFASQVQRFDSTQVAILEGPVTAVNLAFKSLTILGVTVTTRPGADMIKGTSPYADFAAFAAQLAPGSTVVKVKGMIEGGNFSASSLEIEQ
jgi:hypothetical protein